jgi:hypothetical protein
MLPPPPPPDVAVVIFFQSASVVPIAIQSDSSAVSKIVSPMKAGARAGGSIDILVGWSSFRPNLYA